MNLLFTQPESETKFSELSMSGIKSFLNIFRYVNDTHINGPFTHTFSTLEFEISTFLSQSDVFKLVRIPFLN